MPIGTGGISPQGGASSFVPPISPPVSGAPGANKYLRSDGAGVVGWFPVPTPGIPDPGGVGYLKETAPGVFTNVQPIPSSDLVVGTAAGSVAADLEAQEFSATFGASCDRSCA